MKTWILLVGLALFASQRPAVAQADDPHAGHRSAMKATVTVGDSRVTLPNVILRDAQNKPFPLSAERFEGKIVVVDFIFTTCTTICPVLSEVMATVQRELGGQVGKDVVLVSISVDPANDTPPVMRAYAKSKGAGKDWYWLTGSSGDIARVLRAFGLSAGRPNSHPPLVMVGDPGRNRWQRWVGIPKPATVVDSVKSMVAQAKSASMSSATAVGDAHAHH